eukprot:8605605-Pyramimonas_sp.AAC.1
MCRCGCRGWCSMYVILFYIRWLLEVLRNGIRPTRMHDGSEICAVVKEQREQHGEDLGFRGVVCWLKGDWSDVNKTH